MGKVTTSIRHCAGNLARFSGRDTPGQFWPWAILIFVLGTIAAMFVMVPAILRSMLAMFQMLDARRHPAGEPVPPEVLEAFMAQYGAELGALWLPMAAINFGSALLLAGAVVRRLHDRDRTGLWGLMPLPFMAISLANMPAAAAMMTGGANLTPLERAASSAGSLYMLALIVLIVLLVGDGTRGPNRFGPDPRERGLEIGAGQPR
jgi:uncharacterized membrane protein YhaH (DUF805 family)